jgi:hypothetical protein
MSRGVVMIMRLAVIFFFHIIALSFLYDTFRSYQEIIPDSKFLSPSRAHAADEPRFLKEGELMFLEKKSNKKIITIDIEIADNDYERTRGLMYRHSLPDNGGMLFIFEKSGPLSFWMRNTYIPLDIIFADEKKRIVTIQEKTEPLSYNAILSKKQAKYVVEVNAGFSDKHRVSVGDMIAFERVRN